METEKINLSRHGHLTWKNFERYTHASTVCEVQLVINEFENVARSLPIGLRAVRDSYKAVCFTGTEVGQNLLVSADGKWLGDYVPASFRSYPFSTSQRDDGTTELAVVRDPEHVGTGYRNPFFERDGSLAAPTKAVLAFLESYQTGLDRTQLFTMQLAALGLIEAWPVTLVFGGKRRIINDLFRVSEEKVRALSGEVLAQLASSGALRLCYAMIFSQQNFQRLVRLAEAQVARVKSSSDVDLDTVLADVTPVGQEKLTNNKDYAASTSFVDDGEIDLASFGIADRRSHE